MEVCNGIDAFIAPATGTTLTIGNFDGVHRGHRHILSTAQRVARGLNTPLAAMTFEPHPMSVVAPSRAPARLVTSEEKTHLLAACGVDVCIVARSEPALLEQSAEEFLDNLVHRCRPRAIVEGHDFNFGRGRGGSVQTLREAADQLGFTVHAVDTMRCEELPGGRAVRSAAIRAALREGQVEVARVMLGRPYRIVGTVCKGVGRGTGLGFPTANLSDIPHAIPAEAVYAAAAELADGTQHLAAVNIGPQPTFDQGTTAIEAHLLDWSGPLVGQRLALYFLARLRPQRRFGGADELAAQLRQDIAATRAQSDALTQIARAPRIHSRASPVCHCCFSSGRASAPGDIRARSASEGLTPTPKYGSTVQKRWTHLVPRTAQEQAAPGTWL